MKRDRSVSCVLTQEEYEALYVKVAKRGIMDKKHVTLSSYIRDLVIEDLNGDNTVSPPEVDTDSKQKNKDWGTLSMDDMFDE